jgi:hypothetical protein
MKKIANMMKAMIATPPTTPPTLAPILLGLEDVGGTGAVVALESLFSPPVGVLDCSVFEVGLEVDCDGESVVVVAGGTD